MIVKTRKEVETYWVRIYMSGPIDQIKQACREECYYEGLCVTVKPCSFIYTMGEEEGVEVGLVNYPRFPKEPHEIRKIAVRLAHKMVDASYQGSVMIMTPEKTHWLSRREGD